MTFRHLAFAIALLLLISGGFASSTLSNNTIECCSPWQSTLTIRNSDGSPYPNCRVYMSVMETKGVIDTTISTNSYFTDSTGSALLYYAPQKPGEKLKISFACGENRGEYTLIVTGVGQPPALPQINIPFPSLEAGQTAVIVFIIFGAVFIWKGAPLVNSIRKASSTRREAKANDAAVEEMSPRRLIMEHERKVAAKMAKKHRRKEIRLDHEFMRKL